MRRTLITSASALALLCAPAFAQTNDAPPPPAESAEDSSTTTTVTPTEAPAGGETTDEATSDDAEQVEVEVVEPEETEPTPAEADQSEAEPVDVETVEADEVEADQVDTGAADRPTDFLTLLPPTHMGASDEVIGANVVTMMDESAGSIQDLIFDIESGRVEYAVLSIGGFLGIGTKTIAVPWQMLSPAPMAATTAPADGGLVTDPAAGTAATVDPQGEEVAPDTYVIDMTYEQLEAAPDFVWRDTAAAQDGTAAPVGDPAAMPQ